jgi:hypothetical protein
VTPHAAALAVDAGAFSGCADVLARKSARNDVNNAAPRSSVKGLNVIPNRERRENAVILSGGKNASWVGFPLDGADGSPSKQVSAKYSATSACEKSQLIHSASIYINLRSQVQRHGDTLLVTWGTSTLID